MEIINPANGEILTRVPEDNASSLQTKYDLLKAAQPSWSRILLEERISILEKYSSLLERDMEWLAQTLTDEVGKPLQQSRNEINGSRTRIQWMLKPVSYTHLTLPTNREV